VKHSGSIAMKEWHVPWMPVLSSSYRLLMD